MGKNKNISCGKALNVSQDLTPNTTQEAISGQKTASDVNELCKRLGISRSHFYKLLKDGCGPIITKIGNRTIITSANEDAWLESLEIQS